MKNKEFQYLSSFESVKKLKAWFMRKAGRKEWFSERGFLQYLRGVKDFMKYVYAKDPDQVLEKLKGNVADATARVNDWVAKFAERGWSPSTQVHFCAYMKRFLTVNDVEVD